VEIALDSDWRSDLSVHTVEKKAILEII